MPILLAGLALAGGVYTALRIKRTTKRCTASALSKNDSPLGCPTRRNSAEIEARQHQHMAVSALGFAGLGMVVNPVLAVGAVPLIALCYLTMMREVREAYLHKSKRLVTLFDAVSATLVLFLSPLWVIAFLLMVLFSARRLIAMTERQTQTDYSRIFSELSNTVWLLKNGAEIETPLDNVQANDIIVVHAGEMIPVDGQIVLGEGLLDQHLLTGESQPVEKKVGEQVLASTLLIAGTLQVRVGKHGMETITGQIALTLQQTADYKQQLQSRGDEIVEKGISKTLVICAASLPFVPLSHVLALGYSGFGYQMRAAAPLMVFNYLRLAFQRGIVVKDGRALDKLHRIDTVIFDKTGTLTQDIPQIAQVLACGDGSSEELIQYAASAEQRQQHPIGLAICGYAQQQRIQCLPLRESEYAIGHGLRAELRDPSVSKRTVLIGSQRFMQNLALPLPEPILSLQDEANHKGHSVVYVALETHIDTAVTVELLGAIELAPVLRPQAQETIEVLHQLGIKTAIISGDQQQPTAHLAQQLGIDDYFAETLPQDKARIVVDLQADGHTVCFVGDGINDSVALQKADVSISLHGAATIAQDTADIVLATPDLSHIPWLVNLSKDLHQRMDVSEAMNLGLGGTCVAGVLVFGMGLSGALLLYSGGMVLSVSNAMLPLLQQVNDPVSLKITQENS